MLKPSACLPRGARTRLLLLLWIALLVLGVATRLSLALGGERPIDAAVLPQVLGIGAVYDALVAVPQLALIALLLASMRGEGPARPRLRFGVLTALVGAAVFGAMVEYFFFEEFSARFNHVALDYLLFPDEVAGNMWESYPVPLYVGLALLVGAIGAWLIGKGLAGSERVALSPLRRVGAIALTLGAVVAAISALGAVPARASGDRQRDEIASNGLVQLVRAYQTASLDYASYYRTLPEARMHELAAKELGRAPSADGQCEFRALERREQPLDIVVVLGESFGSEFVGRLGGRKPCAPGLERWAQQGTLLTHLIATGNRTVRGLESVLCSFVPLPGDSIWKRSEHQDVASLASVLGAAGYRTEFVYGGDGAFDRMRQFALANGWQTFLDDALIGKSAFPEDAFRTIWGVDDASMYDVLLERQRQAKRDGVRYFGTALTVTNHKPFLNPDSANPTLRKDKLVSAGITGLVLLVCAGAAWRWLRPHVGRTRLWVGYGLVAAVYAALTWTSVQPRDSRESAVRYADRSLANYFERAKSEGLLEHTVVLFVADHGARVYGAEEIPAGSYRIPALILAPEARYQGRTIDRLCSQVDLAPTLLSIAGVDARAPFFGRDLLQMPADAPGRAWLIHNRDIGLLTDHSLTVLGLRRTTTAYRRSGPDSDVFEPLPVEQLHDAEADRVAAVFQLASSLYESGSYRLLQAP
jgi:phosphoglycerol transferase MdoB-like AlkP superfamily enzyme